MIRRFNRRRQPQVFYSMEEVAEAAGFVFSKRSARKGELNTQKARRWLKRSRALIKMGRLYYTTKALLVRACGGDSDVAAEIMVRLPEW